ncbi:hypothetical protein CGZ97_06600 [Enemella evansiae]|nr:hypothetical protein CGZ97_06600 [Enemella evansiae]
MDSRMGTPTTARMTTMVGDSRTAAKLAWPSDSAFFLPLPPRAGLDFPDPGVGLEASLLVDSVLVDTAHLLWCVDQGWRARGRAAPITTRTHPRGNSLDQ